MEYRALLAVVLSLAAFYLVSVLFPGPQNMPPVSPVQPQATSAVAKPVAVASPVLPKPTAPPADKEVTVETETYRATFSTRGAVITRFMLKSYTESAQGDKVFLIGAESPKASFQTGAQGFALDPAPLYSVSSSQLKLTDAQKGQIEFTHVTDQGVVVRKVYSFSGNTFGIQLSYEIINKSASAITGSITTTIPYDVLPPAVFSRFESSNAVTLAADDFNTDKTAKLDKEISYSTQVAWSGFADKYFLTALIGEKGSIASTTYRKADADNVKSIVSSPPLKLGVGEAAAANYQIYMGPKDLDILRAQGHDLERALDLGWFSAIAKPLLRVLKFFYGYTHNYGLAIIIITVIIKILFAPLTHKSYVSMKEMQKLQPKMVELREKYKNDKDAMNRAIFDLYRTHKVNPLGGCLPLLVQFPVFIALYNALMNSIELRNAPFMLWIQDLSAKDPYYITPIIMGATMFIQQKMTPTTNMDPIQAKVMLFLPVIFTVMFLGFPSGLVLYWLINNILTIAQQYYINKFVKV